MKQRYLYCTVMLLGLLVTNCQQDLLRDFHSDHRRKDDVSIVSMVTERADGILRLSIDAPAPDRADVWIDLNGDGLRACDGAEEVKVFNTYRDYPLASGVKKIAIHGNITYLAATSNRISEVNVSGNPYLVVLNLSANDLTEIDLSHNIALKSVDISNNKIHLLDISTLSDIVSLWCFNNKLKSLDLLENSMLTDLDCSGNELNTLDISANGKLKRILAYNNQLETLDISKNPLINRLWLFGNLFCETEKRSLVSAFGNRIYSDLWLTEEVPYDELAIKATIAEAEP